MWYFELSQNFVTGTVPSEVFAMTGNEGAFVYTVLKCFMSQTILTSCLLDLRMELSLGENLLSGGIPSEVGLATNLRESFYKSVVLLLPS